MERQHTEPLQNTAGKSGPSPPPPWRGGQSLQNRRPGGSWRGPTGAKSNPGTTQVATAGSRARATISLLFNVRCSRQPATQTTREQEGSGRPRCQAGAWAPRAVCSLGMEAHGSVLRGHSRHLVCLLRPQHRVLPGGGAHRSLTRSSRVAPSSRAAQAPQGKQAGGPGACPRGQGGVCKPSWRPLGATHMLVLIRDWLLAGVSSPWLPSLGGDCSGQEGAQPGAAQVLPAP